ncbi:Paramyosin [Dorcoceras hygrometricum]|uniref:Paramyosin n=1 Tax=Dorcoceras hygrometricum TaxID=472368 RepID=A0A2Z7CMF3_9LAMI|nr:Paramyosin [Dorcoceras hygrometricum]
MASSLIKNASQIYFDSVLGMEDEGMVAMFEALVSSGLSGFLGCSSAIYEAALVEFFHNTSRHLDSVTTDPIVHIEIVQNPAPTESDSFSQRNRETFLNSPSPSTSADSRMLFTTDDFTLGDEPTAVLPQDLANEFAQLRAFVYQIALEHVQTRVHIERVKAEFFEKISILETLLLTRADNQDRAARVQTEIFQKEVKYEKPTLSKEFDDRLAVIRNYFLEFRAETQEQYTTLRDNLAELIAFFNRGRDEKRGKCVAVNVRIEKFE